MHATLDNPLIHTIITRAPLNPSQVGSCGWLGRARC